MNLSSELGCKLLSLSKKMLMYNFLYDKFFKLSINITIFSSSIDLVSFVLFSKLIVSDKIKSDV